MRITQLLAAAGAAGSLLAVALLAPMAQELFAAHMAQHLILIAAAAPLTALAWRRPLVPPLAAWIGFVSVFLFWHWPAAFRWAAHAPITERFELTTIYAAATLFWSTMLAPGRSGAAALAVTTAAFATDLPGVVMIFAPRAICTMPDENAARFGLSALQDQQLAGLLMWVPANIVFFAIATFLFARWMAAEHSSLVTS